MRILLFFLNPLLAAHVLFLEIQEIFSRITASRNVITITVVDHPQGR